ncbi:MAG: shikimate kinase [Actinomycetota bacterium]
MTARTFIVTGIPASGKSSVGRGIAKALDIPFFDRDDFLDGAISPRLAHRCFGRQGSPRSGHTCTNRCTYRRRWEDQIVFIESRLPHDSLIDSS